MRVPTFAFTCALLLTAQTAYSELVYSNFEDSILIDNPSSKSSALAGDRFSDDPGFRAELAQGFTLSRAAKVGSLELVLFDDSFGNGIVDDFEIVLTSSSPDNPGPTLGSLSEAPDNDGILESWRLTDLLPGNSFEDAIVLNIESLVKPVLLPNTLYWVVLRPPHDIANPPSFRSMGVGWLTAFSSPAESYFAGRNTRNFGDPSSIEDANWGGGPALDGRTLRVYSVIESVKIVQIDIKPGSHPNCFNQNGHGVIPVAVLGSADFDVSQIDTSTLVFGGLEIRVRGNSDPMCSLSDVNDDGVWDLVCQFEDDSDLWAPGDGEATLSGALLDGTEIEGSDSICIVP